MDMTLNTITFVHKVLAILKINYMLATINIVLNVIWYFMSTC